ncbi:hypothetical protein GQX74_011338 [Glossina fuscipes]|nr:hypothetical protein GQX74_011338 [Glossina fuscipes]
MFGRTCYLHARDMIIKYTPKDWFRGKMYVSQHSKDCMIQGNGKRSTLLRLTIGSEAKENKCGILRAYEVTKNYQSINFTRSCTLSTGGFLMEYFCIHISFRKDVKRKWFRCTREGCR